MQPTSLVVQVDLRKGARRMYSKQDNNNNKEEEPGALQGGAAVRALVSRENAQGCVPCRGPKQLKVSE